MRNVLISSFDMSVGGVERSLIGLLGNFDYGRYNVDLMLYRHQGDFMSMLPDGPRLLEEIPEYAAFRKSIREITAEGLYKLAYTRIKAKYAAELLSHRRRYRESGYFQMQLGWKYATPYLPRIQKEYDTAVSFLWPHYFVGEKVNSRQKIAWIHTDYSALDIDYKADMRMWKRFDRIVAVSESCRSAFLERYPLFEERTVVIENILTPEFIRKMSESDCCDEMNGSSEMKIVTVARLTFQKGIDDAVKACRILLDEGYGIKWYVVGYGSAEKEIFGLIEKLRVKDNFILLGGKVNPYPYMRACDIYVQPSRYEGKAVTVREAQILGKPVLITGYGTAASQVTDGIDGIITASGVEGIVTGVKRLVDKPELRKMLEYNTSCIDYGNAGEIDRLYELMEI